MRRAKRDGVGAEPRRVMTRYESRDGRIRLFRGDSRRLGPIAAASVGVIVTSPPYWISGRGRASAERYARQLAVDFGREWRRVLASDGDLWLVIGDRHDGAEWVGLDGVVTGWLRRTGWRLQSRGFWAQTQLAGAVGQPRELPPALPEGHRRARAAARHDALLHAALAALAPGQPVGRHPRAGRPGDPRGEPQARARPRSLRGRRHDGPRGAGVRARVDRRGAGSPHGRGHGAPLPAHARQRGAVSSTCWPSRSTVRRTRSPRGARLSRS